MVLVYYFAFNKSYLLMGSLNRYLLNQIFNQQKQFLYLVSISTEKGQLVKLQLSKKISSKLNVNSLSYRSACRKIICIWKSGCNNGLKGITEKLINKRTAGGG